MKHKFVVEEEEKGVRKTHKISIREYKKGQPSLYCETHGKYIVELMEDGIMIWSSSCLMDTTHDIEYDKKE